MIWYIFNEPQLPSPRWPLNTRRVKSVTVKSIIQYYTWHLGNIILYMYIHFLGSDISTSHYVYYVGTLELDIV